MPYVLDSPISQGLAAATGVLAGAQQKKAQQYAVDRQTALDRQKAEETAAKMALAEETAKNTQAYRQAQLAQGQQRVDVAKAGQALTQQRITDQEKRDAQREIDRKHDQDLAAAKFQYEQDRDARNYNEKVREANQTHNDRVAALKQAKTLADARNAITLDVADIREKGANARFAEGQAGLESRFDRGQAATESRFVRGQKATQNRFNLEHGQKPRNLSPVEVQAIRKEAAKLVTIGPDGKPVLDQAGLAKMAQTYNMTLDQAASFVP